MKLKYHLRGPGIGFILTTIILMISNLFVNNNNGNNHVSDNKETSGSVIAYTTVTIKFENVIYGTAAAELLYKAGVIDDENSFAFYLQNSGYDAIIRDGLYQINIGDSYENIAKIITKS